MLILSGLGNVMDQSCNANTSGTRQYIQGYINMVGACEPRAAKPIMKAQSQVEQQEYKGLIIKVVYGIGGTRTNPTINPWQIIVPMKGEFPGFNKAKAIIDGEE